MDEHIDSLIARRLSGECNPAEDAELAAWIAAAPENAAYFQEMESAWHAMDSVLSGPIFNTEAAWEQVAPRLQKTPQQHTENGKPERKTIQFSTWIKYATAAAAVLIIAVMFFRPEAKQIQVLASNDNQVVHLPDNSVIRLRKGSSIRYAEHFTGTERLVHLDGEAFFDVSKREEQRFVVDAGSVAVTVLGTSFNVKSGSNAADVSVATGRVQVLAKDDAGKKILLKAGRAVHFGNGSFGEGPATSSDTAWMSSELAYTTTPLRQIIAELSKDADTAISIDPGISAELLNEAVQIRFKKTEFLAARLRALGSITGTEAVLQGKSYLIRMRRP
jgi:transmembrane sensor